MFTGIVDHCGIVVGREPGKDSGSLILSIEAGFEDLARGESIAIDGVCVTVTEPFEGGFACDISPETLALTQLGSRVPHSRVNLERALRLSDRLGGHLVTGHVDGTCRLASRETRGEFELMVFDNVPSGLMRFVHKKGSVAVNGVSLTLNERNARGFEVMLIPHTLGRTNLGELEVGSGVNIEMDWMVKVILKGLDEKMGSVSTGDREVTRG